MAARLLIPGFGGKYTSEAFTSSSTTGADTLDAANCSRLGIQLDHTSTSPTTPVGSFKLIQTFDGLNWADLGSAILVTTDGTVSKFSEDDGPFGMIQIDATAITTGGTVTVTIVGF